MVIAYKFATRVGTFWIRIDEDGRWNASFEEEGLGNYYSPELASDDLAGGHTYTPSCGDTARLGISADLSDWTRIVSR